MPSYSARSKEKLATCHPDLQRLFNEVIKSRDNMILIGHRNQMLQDKAFREGRSKIKWPNGKHNTSPSQAVDSINYHATKPNVRWNDLRSIYLYAGYVIATAEQMGIPLRWGGDWDGDTDIHDQNFNDLVHFELIL